jgi:carbamoyltransferase
MYILGLSAYYHDSAAVLLKDGKILCAMEEERFSRIKHDNSFPFQAVRFCIDRAGISINDIDYVSYYEKPLLKFERIIDSFVATYPKALFPFLKGMPEWLDYKIKVGHTIRNALGFQGKVLFTHHHVSHASAAFFPSPFKEAAILTIDGVGEYQTTGLWSGKERIITPLKRIDFPHSLGLLYSAFTAFIGFKVNEDEYKLMGLAAYGRPLYMNKIKQIISIKDDGGFALDMRFFSFREDFRMWNSNFEKLFGKPRDPDKPLTKKFADIASSIQTVTEEVYFKILRHLHEITQSENVCINGGVALNALANGKIFSHTPFRRVFILGTAGDSGAALGSALFSHHHLCPKAARKPILSLSLGSSYPNSEVEKILKQHGLGYEKMEERALIKSTAKLLARGKIVGWFQGGAEFGPRALGNHSILCKPNPREMKARMNVIKRREQFRPFAGSVLQEHVHEYFEVPEKNHWSPFMVFCFPVKKDRRKDLAAIVHKDNTCRIQTVNKENGRYYLLIKEFRRQTGLACILNTSFNLKGEPIVETPQQAIEDYLKTKMDYLVIENFLISKKSDAFTE